jgi:carboxymethylenebutenolidase
MQQKQDFVTLTVGDGTMMNAYTSMPSGAGPFPGLMLFQEAFGVNHHIRDLAQRFAREGYVVIAPELYHRTAPAGYEGPYNDFPAIAPHMQALTQAGMEADLRAVWSWLQGNPQVLHDKIGSTGYCMGGRVSFLANAILPLQAAVSYYGARIAPDLIKKVNDIHAPMLFFWGGLDKHIPREQISIVVDEMTKAGKEFINVEISYAGHAFFCDERPGYNAQAAAEAWALTLVFLSTRLKKTNE